MMRIEVRKNWRGIWCVWLDGVAVSSHGGHAAARVAAQGHATPIRSGGDR